MGMEREEMGNSFSRRLGLSSEHSSRCRHPLRCVDLHRLDTRAFKGAVKRIF